MASQCNPLQFFLEFRGLLVPQACSNHVRLITPVLLVLLVNHTNRIETCCPTAMCILTPQKYSNVDCLFFDIARRRVEEVNSLSPSGVATSPWRCRYPRRAPHCAWVSKDDMPHILRLGSPSMLTFPISLLHLISWLLNWVTISKSQQVSCPHALAFNLTIYKPVWLCCICSL